MTKQQEPLVKAHHDAQFLVEDLKLALIKTRDVATEIVLTDLLESAHTISGRLGRLTVGVE